MYGTYIMQRCFHSFANNGLILKRIYKNACMCYLHKIITIAKACYVGMKQRVDKLDGVCVVFRECLKN